MEKTLKIFDCGCVLGKDINCKRYGTRWRVLKNSNKIVLRCLDCKKDKEFKVKNDL